MPDFLPLPCQVAEGLQLSGEQRRGVASLWRNFDGRLARILGARRSMHGAITSTMPNGIMGRDFAVNFLKVPACCPSRLTMLSLSRVSLTTKVCTVLPEICRNLRHGQGDPTLPSY